MSTFGAPTEFVSHGPGGIYQRANIAKTVRTAILARPPQGAYAHTGPQVCVPVQNTLARRRPLVHVHVRTQSRGDSVLHRRAVISAVKIKKREREREKGRGGGERGKSRVFAKFDMGICAVVAVCDRLLLVEQQKQSLCAPPKYRDTHFAYSCSYRDYSNSSFFFDNLGS